MVTWLRLNADLILDPGWVTLPDDHARAAYIEALCRAKWQDSPLWISEAHFRASLGPYGDALEALISVGLLQRYPDGAVGLDLDDWEATQFSDVKGKARQRKWVLDLKAKAAQAKTVTNGTTERDGTQRDLTQRNEKEPNETEREDSNLFEEEWGGETSAPSPTVGSEMGDSGYFPTSAPPKVDSPRKTPRTDLEDDGLPEIGEDLRPVRNGQ